MTVTSCKVFGEGGEEHVPVLVAGVRWWLGEELLPGVDRFPAVLLQELGPQPPRE